MTPSDHNKYMRSLIISLCGALQMGILPTDLDLKGIVADSVFPSYKTYDCTTSLGDSTIDDSEPEPCLCRFVSQHFFLQNLVWLNGTYYRREYRDYCISWEDQIEIMAKRDDSREFFASGKPFLVLLRDGCYRELDDFLLGEFHPEEWDAAIEEMRNRGISVEAGIYFLESEAMKRIRCLIEVFGYSPQILSQEQVTNALTNGIECSFSPRPTKVVSGRRMLPKDQYNQLSSLGFDIDLNVFVAVSEDLDDWMDSSNKKRRCN